MSDSTFGPVSIRAWSAITGGGCLLYRHGAATGALEKNLEPHEGRFGIPGYSGFLPREIPLSVPFPKGYEAEESRTLHILWAALTPLLETIEPLRARFGKERIALVVGSSTGGIDRTEAALAFERVHGRLPDEYDFDRAHSYESLVSVCADALGISGPAYVISTACSSGAKALASAARLLESGEADVVIAGGADALCELTIRGFAGLGILAENGCRPFSKDRAGISIGEGGALVVLTRDGDGPLFLRGVGESNDAFHATAPDPEGVGARLAISRALSLSSASNTDVVYVNAHGTGTIHNDAMESLAISMELGNVPFSSTKDRTGHLLGAAGAVEAVICLDAMLREKFPPNGFSDSLDSNLPAPPLASALETELGPKALVLSNSFAFGGNNISVALGKSIPEPPRPKPRRRVFVRAVALHGSGYSSLAAFLEGRVDPNLGDAPANGLPARIRGRASALCRLLAELSEHLDERASGASVPLFTGSAYGEMSVTLDLLSQLGDAQALSPAKFQGSVHNATAGLLTLLGKNRSFSTAIACGRNTLGATLLDAIAWLRTMGGEARVLVGDADSPARLLPSGASYANFGFGLHLEANEGVPAGALAEITSLRRVRRSERKTLGVEENLHEAGLALVRTLFDERAVDRATIAFGPDFELSVELGPLGSN